MGKRKQGLPLAARILLPLAVFAALMTIFVLSVSNLNRVAEQEALEGVRRAVMNAVVQCYALEGGYPPDVAYLEEHYGLQVDSEQYVIHYNIFASNLLPEVQVLPVYSLE
ncbi:MAG: hypothetical protein ACK5LX_15105 [Oscillospiraceae bacterium]